MSLLQRGLMFVLAAGTLALPLSIPPETRAGGRAAAPVEEKTESLYTPQDKEFYLDQDYVDFIRPGLKVTIGAVTNMTPGQKPIVEVTLTDDLNQPLDRLGGKTPGVVSLRFIPAVWDPATGYYDDLITSNGMPSRDNTGQWADLGDGKYRYTFAATMPNFDVNKPMTLAVTGNRNMQAYIEKTYYVNVFKDFVPATGAAATTWAVTTTAKCNACHDPIVGHGSNYREMKTCSLCHNPNDMKGNLQPYDMGMWHLIHSSNLDDVGDIHYPQYYIQNCEACHDSKQPQGTVFLTKPGANSCGGCHADIDFAAGVGHPAQANDNACKNCHIPDSGQEFDASVKGAHVLPLESKQLKGLKAEILSVTNVAPGQKPIVTFKLSNADGTILDPKPFGSNVNVLVAGPTVDYATWPVPRENASGAVFNGTTAVYPMTWTVPADFKGSLTFSMDVRRSVTVNGRTFNEGAFNPIYHAASTGTVVARRNVVSQAKCLACHDWLPLHGGQRLAIAECLLCHAPNGDDKSRRPATAGLPESIQMARMIHRIHAGANLDQEYTVYGFGGTPYNYNDVHYPGDLRNCAFCHTSQTTANLPAPKGTLNVITLRDYFTPQGPGTAACLGCHDSRDAAAHAYLNTAVFGESCGACHGTNSEWSVAKSHAR